MSIKKRRLASGATKSAYQERDRGGSSRQDFIDWKKVSDDAPKFYQPGEGSHKINIVPFEIKSKLHPSVKKGVAEVGDLHYMLDVFVHRFIGPNKADVLCPKKNYGKPCPICDQVSALYDEGKDKEAKDLQASRRALLNVQVIGKKGPEEGLLVFNVSHFLFMKELLEEAHECGDGNDILEFADPETGTMVSFRVEMEKLGKNDVPKFKSFKFPDREEELDETLIDRAWSFDAGLTLLESEAIEALMYGADDDEEDEPPVRGKASKSRKEDDGEEEEEEEEDERPARGGRRSKKEAEEDEAPESEEEERTARSRSKASKPKDDDEGQDEDEPPPAKQTSKAKKAVKVTECPHGHGWGEADKHRQCTKCPHWDDCMDAQ